LCAFRHSRAVQRGCRRMMMTVVSVSCVLVRPTRHRQQDNQLSNSNPPPTTRRPSWKPRKDTPSPEPAPQRSISSVSAVPPAAPPFSRGHLRPFSHAPARCTQYSALAAWCEVRRSRYGSSFCLRLGHDRLNVEPIKPCLDAPACARPFLFWSYGSRNPTSTRNRRCRCHVAVTPERLEAFVLVSAQTWRRLPS